MKIEKIPLKDTLNLTQSILCRLITLPKEPTTFSPLARNNIPPIKCTKMLMALSRRRVPAFIISYRGKTISVLFRGLFSKQHDVSVRYCSVTNSNSRNTHKKPNVSDTISYEQHHSCCCSDQMDE